MAKRGNEITEAADRRFREERDAVVITQHCAHCGELVAEGPLGECRPAYLAHLKESHPEIKVTQRVRRHRIGGPRQTSQRSIDENIALTRAQGGAAWLGEDSDLAVIEGRT